MMQRKEKRKKGKDYVKVQNVKYVTSWKMREEIGRKRRGEKE